MEEQPDGKDAASEGQKHLPRGQSLLMNGRFAFWAALRLGSHGPSPGQSRTKKVLLFVFGLPRAPAPGGGPPAVLRRGPCAPPGCLPRLRAPAGCFSGRGSRPAAVPPAPSRVRAAFAVLPAAPPGRRRAGAPRRCGPTVPPADSAAKIRHAALDKARDSRYT